MARRAGKCDTVGGITTGPTRPCAGMSVGRTSPEVGGAEAVGRTSEPIAVAPKTSPQHGELADVGVDADAARQ